MKTGYTTGYTPRAQYSSCKKSVLCTTRQPAIVMLEDEIKALIERGVPNSEAIVNGGEGKYEATVISECFEGMSMVKEHQLVYATVKSQIASGALHALSIRTFTPSEWEQQTAS